ncbi:LapA family protein [Capillibacterium thermochitinicola]|uniref:LapA family protein n=1 Tax=Capillibacterium thermochitinicola TaxID=2699427 RepID=A0A8J6HZP1_9FIRM|nr:LapA family protein [Capillibacterium thermochitinicola]MBA2133030.1 LapA family protein [Capillibacterium thermochitinicola]
MQFMLILMLVFAVLVATFALQNAYPVTIYFLKWQFEASFALVILLSLLIGAVAVGSLGLVHQATERLKALNQSRGKGERNEEAGDIPTGKPEEIGAVGADTKENAAGGVDDSAQEVEG